MKIYTHASMYGRIWYHTHTHELHPNKEAKKQKNKRQQRNKTPTKNPLASHRQHSGTVAVFVVFIFWISVLVLRDIAVFILISCRKCIATPSDQRIGNGQKKKQNRNLFS